MKSILQKNSNSNLVLVLLFSFFTLSLSAQDFSPEVSFTIDNPVMGQSSTFSFEISQSEGEADILNSTITTNGGSFDLASLTVGDVVGSGSGFIGGGSSSGVFSLVVNAVTENSADLDVVDSNSDVIGMMNISNSSNNGVSIYASNTYDDGNNVTAGNLQQVELTGIFTNPMSSSLVISSFIFSELENEPSADYSTEYGLFGDFSPAVSVSLSSQEPSTFTNLTFSVSQDAGETDMASALFVSDGGSFTLSSMTIGDNIGSATFTYGLGSYSTGLFVSSITSNTATISDSLGNIFALENLSGGGVSITATSPGDNNSLTSGNSSSVTFNNVFHNPNSGVLNFNSTITSELGEVDSQSFTFYMSCIDFSPTVLVSISDNTCDVLTDLSIDVSQDGNEADIDSAVFVSDGGSFDISNNILGDNVGTANVLFANGTNVNSNLVLSNINSLDDFEVQSIDTNGLVLGTFSVVNLPAGGVNIVATSPSDGNSSTNGYVSNATFTNLFVNPNTNPLNFTTTITSELGHADVQSFSLTICSTKLFLIISIGLLESFNLSSYTKLVISVAGPAVTPPGAIIVPGSSTSLPSEFSQ